MIQASLISYRWYSPAGLYHQPEATASAPTLPLISRVFQLATTVHPSSLYPLLSHWSVQWSATAASCLLLLSTDRWSKGFLTENLKISYVQRFDVAFMAGYQDWLSDNLIVLYYAPCPAEGRAPPEHRPEYEDTVAQKTKSWVWLTQSKFNKSSHFD